MSSNIEHLDTFVDLADIEGSISSVASKKEEVSLAPLPSASLCEVCHNLADEHFSRRRPKAGTAFEYGARKGCSTCGLLVRCLDQFINSHESSKDWDPERDVKLVLWSDLDLMETGLRVKFMTYNRESDSYDTDFSNILCPSRGSLSAAKLPRCLIDVNVTSASRDVVLVETNSSI